MWSTYEQKKLRGSNPPQTLLGLHEYEKHQVFTHALKPVSPHSHYGEGWGDARLGAWRMTWLSLREPAGTAGSKMRPGQQTETDIPLCIGLSERQEDEGHQLTTQWCVPANAHWPGKTRENSDNVLLPSPRLLPQLLPSKMGPSHQNVLESVKGFFVFFFYRCTSKYLHVRGGANIKDLIVKGIRFPQIRDLTIRKFTNNFKDIHDQEAQLKWRDTSDISCDSLSSLFTHHIHAVWLRITEEASRWGL